MSKGERTRDHIISTAAPLFNRLGYSGATVADLMAASGLEKGGLYRHFASKEDIALAAFDHSARLHGDRIRSFVLAAGPTASARLVAVAEAIASLAENPVVPGGCPLLNTAIESDDAEGPMYPALRARVRGAMTRLLGAVHDMIADGIVRGEFRAEVNPDAEASGIVAMLEGALMLSKLYDDSTHMRHAVERIRALAGALTVPQSDSKRR